LMSQLSFDALFSEPVDALRPAEKNVRADALEPSKTAEPVPGRKRTITGDDPRKAFLSTFRETARYHHRYEVFSDFVKLTACALENLLLKSPDIEAEYLATIQRYEKADQQRMAQLYSWLIIGLDQGMGDFLGSLFMELELGSGNIGQFFTPFHLSELMAGLVAGDRQQPDTEVSARDVYAVLVSRDVHALADVSLTPEAGRAILPDNAWQKTTCCRYRANLPIGAGALGV